MMAQSAITADGITPLLSFIPLNYILRLGCDSVKAEKLSSIFFVQTVKSCTITSHTSPDRIISPAAQVYLSNVHMLLYDISIK